MPISPSEREELDFQLGQLFKPSMPINRQELFFGRRQQTRDVFDTVNQNGQHVILYGERGVGKTSLANMIFFGARSPGTHLITPHVNCSSTNEYGPLWLSVLQDMAYHAQKQEIQLPRSFRKLTNEFENGLRADFSPDIARRVVTDLWEHDIRTIIIIDEFDTIQDQQTRQAMAETIKYFSDRNVPGTIVLIGVADDVESLITEHRSVERCIKQVRMPRMSRDEIEKIVTDSLTKLKMSVEEEALHEISRIAIGLPHYAHLLGLHAGREAVHDGARTILQKHITAAVRKATQMAQVTIHRSYSRATISTKKNALYKQVLLACALAETDEFGYFSPADVRPPLERILKREYGVEAFARHLHAFSGEERGPVLKRGDLVNRPRFRFQSPLMQPFVLMKGLDEGMISDDDLKATRDARDGRLF